MSRDAAGFLEDAATGNSYEAFKWKDQPIGTTVKGVIMDNPKSVMRKSLNDGTPEEQLPINLETESGPRTLWVRAGALANAIKEASAEANSGIAKGGTLAVKLTELRDTGKPQPAYIFKAKYEAPAPTGVDMEEIF